MGHLDVVTNVAFSPDGSTLASASLDNTVFLWDVVTGAYKETLIGHTDAVTSVAFSPDGGTLASGSEDEAIRLWDAVTGAPKRTLTGHTSDVLCIAFSPDGGTLASGSGVEIRLWDAVTGAHKETLTGHTSDVLSIAFSPDGSTLASGSADATIRLWDAVTGTHKRTLTGHRDPVTSVTFNPDGGTLASGSRQELVLWNAVTGAHKQTLSGHGHRDSITSVAFSPDGSTLVSRSRTEVRLWNLVASTYKGITITHGYRGLITSVTFDSDGGTLASGSEEDTICLWDLVTGDLKRTLTGHANRVTSVAFSPDGGTLASGSEDRTIRLWDVVTGAHKRTFTGHTGSILSVAFSSDGETLASGSEDGTVLLWELIPSTNANATVNISPSPVESPALGEQLTLSLNIADGENVAGYQATVQFDPTALLYMKRTNGDYLPVDAFFVPPVVARNRVTLAATALAGVSNGDGTLAVLTFEVVAVKASALTLFDVILSDSAGKSSRPRFKGGLVVEPPQIAGDVNRDGVVNILDLVRVGSSFGQTGQNSADVNGDGVVNIVDLVLVAGAFGAEAASPSAHPQALAMLTAADVQGWLAQAWGLDLTEATSQRGILFLEQLLAALTPKETALLHNYPNPFNPETWIPYHLAHDAEVQLTIYNTKGAVVRQLELGYQPAGFYTARAKAGYWNGRNESGELVASGIYFYQLRAGDYSALRRMVIVK